MPGDLSALVEPRDGNEAAEVLAGASRDRKRVMVRGGGTKLEWGLQSAQSAEAVDLVFSTKRLNAVVAHRHGDLTATVEAGAVLDEVNRQLARHGQWIPLDPLWSDRATIGGIIATNDSGPRRHRYGAPRDLIIGVELARIDGTLAKAGGIVVKNVAGYDLARLVTGSFGSLGVIITATFKLYPIPPASRTVIIDTIVEANRLAGPVSDVEPVDYAGIARVLEALTASRLTPSAIELRSPPPRLLVRFQSTEVSVNTQSAEAAELCGTCGAAVRIARDDDERREWAGHAGLWERSGAIVRLTLLPSRLVPTLEWLATHADGTTCEVVGRAGLGVLFLRIDGLPGAQSRIVSALRQRFEPGHGSVVLLRASEELKRAVGVWGPMGDAFPLMQAVKRAFDPDGLLNRGRGPGGL